MVTTSVRTKIKYNRSFRQALVIGLIIVAGIVLGLAGYAIMLIRLLIMLICFSLLSRQLVRWFILGPFPHWQWPDLFSAETGSYPCRQIDHRLSQQRLDYLRELHRKRDG
ncbi:MAG TPA: hypothetical protein VH186_16220 [Chloroflexia bacterium]|nr:hypothetical protein [Chloroflexia bacterium]